MTGIKLPSGAWVIFSLAARPDQQELGEVLVWTPIPWKEYTATMVVFAHIRRTNRLVCLKCDRRMVTERSMPRYNETLIRLDLQNALQGFSPVIEKVNDGVSGRAYDAVLSMRDVVMLRLMAEPFPS